MTLEDMGDRDNHVEITVAFNPPMRILVRRLRTMMLVGILALAACTSTDTYTSTQDFQRPSGPVRVLLMPPEIEIYELLASGLEEPRADWTETAKRNVAASLSAALHGRSADVQDYPAAAEGESLSERRHVQLMKLHGAVGASILTFQSQLASKKETFDWTLGSEASLLRDQFGCDYALFVFLRDSYSSGGRNVLRGVLAVLSFGGVWLGGGVQGGVASLIDLKTGDIVWFNSLTSTAGDVLEAGSARDTVDDLLSELPL